MSITNPDDINADSLELLVERWINVNMRIVLARYQDGKPHPEDLFAQLAYSAKIAQEVAADRWSIVADLLRSGTVQSWGQIANAADLTQDTAREGFLAWITSEVDFRRHTVATLGENFEIGLTDADATELRGLAQAVAW
jgi:hypothetical protein